LLSVEPAVWREEAALIPPFYDRFGDRLPAELRAQYEALLARLANAAEDLANDDGSPIALSA